MTPFPQHSTTPAVRTNDHTPAEGRAAQLGALRTLLFDYATITGELSKGLPPNDPLWEDLRELGNRMLDLSYPDMFRADPPTKQRREHELKIDPQPFFDLVSNLKPYELRKDDRGYKVGDTLRLRETRYTGEEMQKSVPLEYTGREARRKVTHILRGPRYGLTEGWVILSLAETPLDLVT